MTMPPDCSTVHMLMMGAMPMVVPWKYTPLQERWGPEVRREEIKEGKRRQSAIVRGHEAD